MKLSRIAWVTLALLLPTLSGCSTPAPDEPESSSDSRSEPELGSIDLRLTFPDGVILESLTYLIVDYTASSVVLEGEIPVGDEPSVSFQIGSLPVSPNYEVLLDGVLSGGGSCRNIFLPAFFSVTPGQTTVVQTTLFCGGESEPVTGDVRVEVAVDYEQCSHVAGITAFPLRVQVGEAISLQVTVNPATGAGVSWQVNPPSSGTFLQDDDGTVTGFACAEVGTHELFSYIPGGYACPLGSRSVSVTCLPSAPP